MAKILFDNNDLNFNTEKDNKQSVLTGFISERNMKKSILTLILLTTFSVISFGQVSFKDLIASFSF